MTMQFIASLSPGNAVNTVFNNIPQTFTHLQLRIFARTAYASTDWETFIQLNSDAGANYTYHIFYGNGSSPSSAGFTGQNYARIGQIPGANATANIFGVAIVDILDYTNTNKNTTIRSLGGYDLNGSGMTGLWSSVWLNTAAVTSIGLGTANTNFATGSTAQLYGITTSAATGA